jgi:hypothetical protein
LHFVTCRLHIGDIHDHRVGFARRELGQRRFHVELERLRLRRGQPCVVERLQRVLPSGHRGVGEDEHHTGLLDVGEGLNLLRVAGSDCDLELVLREHLRRFHEARVDERLHVLLVGRRDHVGGRATLNLLHELLRARKVVRQRQVGCRRLQHVLLVGERVRQRRGREHVEVTGEFRSGIRGRTALAAAATAGEREEDGHHKEERSHSHRRRQ